MSSLDELDVNLQLITQGYASKYFEDEWYRLQQEAQAFTIYANLAAVQTDIPSPITGQKAAFTGQGAGYYDGTNWVKASDGTTLIT